MDAKSNKNQPAKSQPSAPHEAESLDEPTPAPKSSSASQAPAAASAASKTPAPAVKTPLRSRITQGRYLYIIVFLTVVIVAGVVIVVVLKKGTATNNNAPAQKLTTQQLASLAANTTSVGSSNQTLEVQSNAIFDNPVLVKGDAAVAGNLKVGGQMSISSLGVSGLGNFGQLQVTDKLSVAGDAVVQGQLSLQKTLSVSGNANFGTLSAGQINVTDLTTNGDLSLNRHISASGGTPVKTNGGALGAGGTVSNSGSDTAGTVTINTGSGPPIGCFISLSFVQKFSTTPHVVISPANSASASLDFYTNRSATSFSICTANAPVAGTTYVFDYVIFD